MENASKALLIAAAVLIVILLIAFGVSVMNSTEDVAGDATDVGDAIETQAGTAADSAYQALTGQERPAAGQQQGQQQGQ